jgi:GH25 family lysozyme M1 (1,4-beta-N-acetylmuramidase)
MPQRITASPRKIIDIAATQVGVHEGRSPDGHWNNDQRYSDEVPGLAWSDGQPWCSVFVSWCAMRAGLEALYPRTASCDTAGAWYRQRHAFSEYPAIGAQVFYGTTHDLNHTGIVIDFDADTITTIEGNTNADGSREGDGVYRKTRARRATNLVGYGYPAFPEGIVSADRAWAGRAPAPSTPAATPVAPPSAPDIDGVDLSHHQGGVLDFTQAKNAGVKFVIHKATEGTGFVDDHYALRRGQVAKAGLIFGGYHFAHPSVSNGTVQARYFLNRAKLVAGDLRPVLDIEPHSDRPHLGCRCSTVTAAQREKWVAAFAAEIVAQVGVKPIIYTPFDLEQRYGPLWVARYSNTNTPPQIPKPWGRYAIWQFSNGRFGVPNSVPGLGRVDINTLHPAASLTYLRIPTRKKATR